MTLKNRYTLFVLASAASAAVASILTEIALKRFAITSLSIAFLSNICAGLILLIPVVSDGSRSWRGWPAADWMRLVVASLLIFCIGFILYYVAMYHIGASKTTMLGRLETIFVVVLAVLFLGEHWSARHWLASFLAFGGATLVNFDSAIWELRLGFGEGITLLAAIFLAVGIVTLKPLLDRRDPRFVTACGFLIGSAFMAPLAMGAPPTTLEVFPDSPVLAASITTSFAATSVSAIGWSVLFLLIVRGILLGLSWLTYNASMPHLGASRCSILFLSVVFMTLILQLIVDASDPSLGLQVPGNLLSATAGGFIIVFAIILIQRD